MKPLSSASSDLSPPAISVKDVSVYYGDVHALEHVDLDIAPGRICGLIGMNGSGKSTLFKSIMGLVKPDAGTVSISGGTPAQARSNGLISYVPQSEDVDWTFPISVREVAMTGRYGHQNFMRRPRKADKEAVAHALEQVELTDLADRQIGRLSGGQRKRAFVARGIAQDADVLLLDEPFAGVDKKSEATIIRLLISLAAEGKTILISTHDLGSLGTFCDEAVLLMRTVLMHDLPGEVLRPRVLARAFGMDVLDGQVVP
ncbi:ABC-type Mn2+/Zn2+ transport system ATPase subunit [Williamsia limnetica]|uniref:ABC-type Mn2+/Zn2+ transport system ATPase subunit n=1 Tax=Williamsia limnetica TaxID=882452 RepID=A0A318RNP2_WILLI|nr:metal ABC transporter ATP-binding protein [Williamsia limnetica]PYE18012.1 ABC-type Mn2+/Zn2+ transport system ATPase subunit [Williamsia limnetica]